MSETVEYADYNIEDGVAVVTVDRPAVNALNRKVEDEIEKVFEELGTLPRERP